MNGASSESFRAAPTTMKILSKSKKPGFGVTGYDASSWPFLVMQAESSKPLIGNPLHIRAQRGAVSIRT